jgi:hypothetical protein
MQRNPYWPCLASQMNLLYALSFSTILISSQLDLRRSKWPDVENATTAVVRRGKPSCPICVIGDVKGGNDEEIPLASHVYADDLHGVCTRMLKR